MNTEYILEKLKEAFPDKNLSLEFAEEKDYSPVYLLLDGERLGVSWSRINTFSPDPVTEMKGEDAIVTLLIKTITRVLSGNILPKKVKPVAEKPKKKTAKKEKFIAEIPEVLEPTVVEAIDPPIIETKKKKTSKKKKEAE